MTDTLTKIAAWLALAIVFVTTGLGFVHNPSQHFGAAGGMLAENYIPYILYNSGFVTLKPVTIGTNGSAINALQWGTCSLLASNFAVVASSSIPVDCAVTGALTTDTLVLMSLATTTGTGGGWQITGAIASTTAGFISGQLVNNTGGNAVTPASVASSTRYVIFR